MPASSKFSEMDHGQLDDTDLEATVKRYYHVVQDEHTKMYTSDCILIPPTPNKDELISELKLSYRHDRNECVCFTKPALPITTIDRKLNREMNGDRCHFYRFNYETQEERERNCILPLCGQRRDQIFSELEIFHNSLRKDDVTSIELEATDLKNEFLPVDILDATKRCKYLKLIKLFK